MTSASDRRLLAIKLIHTGVWAFFAVCILAIPILGWRGQLFQAGLLCGIVLVEVLVLLFHGLRCPLTRLAARYTEDRRDNFDIFLPERLARHNVMIFGGLYLAGLIVVAYRWLW